VGQPALNPAWSTNAETPVPIGALRIVVIAHSSSVSAVRVGEHTTVDDLVVGNNAIGAEPYPAHRRRTTAAIERDWRGRIDITHFERA
jgi:hypothetical protein